MLLQQFWDWIPWIVLGLAVALLVIWKEISPWFPNMDGDDVGKSTVVAIGIAVTVAILLAWYVLK